MNDIEDTLKTFKINARQVGGNGRYQTYKQGNSYYILDTRTAEHFTLEINQ